MQAQVNTTARVLLIVGAASAQLALGLPPPPTFGGVVVRASVISSGDELRYAFHVANPAGNTLSIASVNLAVKSAPSVALPALLESQGGWSVLAEQRGFASWGPGENYDTPPGGGFEGFGLLSNSPPKIRQVVVEPYLLDHLRGVREEREAEGDELTPEEHRAIEERYVVRLKTLGPLGVSPGTFEHWNTFESDLAQTAELGWISDAALLASLQASLTAARAAVLAHNGPQAIAHLQAMVSAIDGASESQRSSEGYALVKYNAESLRDHLPIPAEPRPVPVPLTR